MITYLNKEAVRNALSDIGMKAGGLWEIIRMVDNGEFDAKFPENDVMICLKKGIDFDQHKYLLEKALAEKDAEIARLKERNQRLGESNLNNCKTIDFLKSKCGGGSRDPWHDSVYQRLERLEADHKDLKREYHIINKMLHELTSKKQ